VNGTDKIDRFTVNKTKTKIVVLYVSQEGTISVIKIHVQFDLLVNCTIN